MTGSRVTAKRERLGDLQLYRVPEPVTVAANAQKQVGLIDQPAVKVTPVYSFVFDARGEGELAGRLLLRTTNRPSEGLGLPLPAGNLLVFRNGARRPLLIGEGAMEDRAVGEKVEVRLSESTGVRAVLGRSDKAGTYRMILTNDRPVPVDAEVELAAGDEARITANGRLTRRDGKRLWVTTISPNSRRELRYRVRD